MASKERFYQTELLPGKRLGRLFYGNPQNFREEKRDAPG
jgi:hypothetical protein